MRGQVAALDSERVVAHTQDGDAQDKDQAILRTQAQEPWWGGGGRSKVFLSFWRSGPKPGEAQTKVSSALGATTGSVRRVPLWPEGMALSSGLGDKTEPR